MSDKKKPIKKVTKKVSKKSSEAKRGRPTKYNPAFCEEAIEVMKKGFSKEAVAGHLGISCDTLYQFYRASGFAIILGNDGGNSYSPY